MMSLCCCFWTDGHVFFAARFKTKSWNDWKIMFSPRTGDIFGSAASEPKENCATTFDLVECPVYQTDANGSRTGCVLHNDLPCETFGNSPTQPTQYGFSCRFVRFLFNNTVDGTLARNTFEKTPSEHSRWRFSSPSLNTAHLRHTRIKIHTHSQTHTFFFCFLIMSVSFSTVCLIFWETNLTVFLFGGILVIANSSSSFKLLVPDQIAHFERKSRLLFSFVSWACGLCWGFQFAMKCTTNWCCRFNSIQKALWIDYCFERYYRCIIYLYFLSLEEVCFSFPMRALYFVNA